MLSESSPVTTVTSDTSADSDGSYVSLISSTTRAYKWMIVSCLTEAKNVDGLLDISVGASGSEVVFLSDRLVSSGNHTFPRKMSQIFYYPVDVASGVEIRARIQDTSSSGIGWGVKVMFSNVLPPLGTPNLMDSSNIISVSSASGSDTYGSYVNMITSLAHDTKWLLIGVGTTNAQSAVFTMEFGIGVGNPPTGTDEIAEFGNQHAADSGGQGSHTSRSMLVPCNFSSGDQLQIRVKDTKSGIVAYKFSINALG